MKPIHSLAALCFLTAPLLSGALPAQADTPEQVKTLKNIQIHPLPGQLDNHPMLNSNSPEIVEESGILVSSIPGKSPAYLSYPFKGKFGLFSHHIAKDTTPGERLLYLGTLVSNPGATPVTLELTAGASYLSQPDALFKPLPALTDNPEGKVFAGPGDRVTTELLAGTSPLKKQIFTIPARSTQLIASLPVPTNVKILPPINGRSTLMYFNASDNLYVSHLAFFAEKKGGQFVAPTLEDYRELLNSGKMAGKREQAPTNYMREKPQGGFRYGRVAGISQGLTWQSKLFQGDQLLQRPGVGETVGYPISAVYLKRMGTEQNQSGELLRRYPDTAYQNHANYGVRYDIEIPLHNRTPSYQTYRIGLSHPSAQNKDEFTYLFPPNKPVMYRGSTHLSWTDEFNQKQERLKHVVLQHGQEAQPLHMFTLAPGVDYDVRLSLYYPADSTPPQLLTVERIE